MAAPLHALQMKASDSCKIQVVITAIKNLKHPYTTSCMRPFGFLVQFSLPETAAKASNQAHQNMQCHRNIARITGMVAVQVFMFAHFPGTHRRMASSFYPLNEQGLEFRQAVLQGRLFIL
jgi:hypothetical protein